MRGGNLLRWARRHSRPFFVSVKPHWYMVNNSKRKILYSLSISSTTRKKTNRTPTPTINVTIWLALPAITPSRLETVWGYSKWEDFSIVYTKWMLPSTVPTEGRLSSLWVKLPIAGLPSLTRKNILYDIPIFCHLYRNYQPDVTHDIIICQNP